MELNYVKKRITSSLNWTHDGGGVNEGLLKFIWQRCVGTLEKTFGTVLDYTQLTVNMLVD